MKKDVKAEITAQIITKIEEAQANGSDWTMPFRSICGQPHNPITGKKYRGMNAFWLGLLGQHTVAGYGQWQDAGWQVQKGSKSILITMPRIGKDKETGEKTVFGFRGGRVFSSSDVLNIETGEAWVNPELPEVDLTVRLANADLYLANLGADLIHTGEGKACYTPSRDQITMPHRELFTATATSDPTENYYSTSCHEHAHWTGAATRLDRLELKNKKGYAFEELVAELSAAFLCNQLDISSEPREDHAQYLAHWLTALGSDNDFIFKAASEAQKVVDYMDQLQIIAAAKAA
jgi:antirestriction protein ArdC